MRKIGWMVLVTVLMFGAFQSRVGAQSLYAGGGFGLNLTAFQPFDANFGFHLRFGGDFNRNFGAYFETGLYFSSGFTLELAAATYAKFSISRVVNPYIGVKLAISPVGYNVFVFKTNALVGLDFRVAKPVSLFIELTPGILIGGGEIFFNMNLLFGAIARF
jgi:hypothetical protein